MAEPFDTQRMLQWKLAGILERHVERIFKPGTKLTIIARTPGNNEADVMVTSDSLPELAELVQRSMARKELPAGAVLVRTAGVSSPLPPTLSPEAPMGELSEKEQGNG